MWDKDLFIKHSVNEVFIKSSCSYNNTEEKISYIPLLPTPFHQNTRTRTHTHTHMHMHTHTHTNIKQSVHLSVTLKNGLGGGGGQIQTLYSPVTPKMSQGHMSKWDYVRINSGSHCPVFQRLHTNSLRKNANIKFLSIRKNTSMFNIKKWSLQVLAWWTVVPTLFQILDTNTPQQKVYK